MYWKAYRRLAKLYHPDLNAGDVEKAERFKEVQRAYETLTGAKEPLRLRSRPRPHPLDDEHPFLRYMHAYLAKRQREDEDGIRQARPSEKGSQP